MSTFDALVVDLARDYQRVRPTDALQFCANWFQGRLQEQRSRIRDSLAHRPSLAATIPPDHFVDDPYTIPQPSSAPITSYSLQQQQPLPPLQGGPATFTNPFPTGGTVEPQLQATEFTNPWATSSRRDSVHPARSQTGLRARFAREDGANYSIDGTPDPHTHDAPSLPPVPSIPQEYIDSKLSSSSSSSSVVAFNNPVFSNPVYDRQTTPSPHPPFASNYHTNPATLGAPTILDRRMSISAEPINLDAHSTAPLPVHYKTEEQMARLRASVSGENFLFNGLDEEQLTGVLNAMQERNVKKNEVIILQGENGTEFYVVESGKCSVFKDVDLKAEDTWGTTATAGRFTKDDQYTPSKQGGHMDDHKVFGKWQIDCGPGSGFGELALMYGHSRAATVVAREDSTLWVVDRDTFRTIILSAANRRRNMYEHFVSMVPLLSALSSEERSKVADALVTTVYEDGQAVVREGELGDKFFFIEDGEAIVTKLQQGPEDGQLLEVQVGHYTKRGDYFGGEPLFSIQCFLINDAKMTGQISYLVLFLRAGSPEACTPRCDRQGQG